ncbi:MAG TPA: glycosyltransferase family 4 protein [Candidatus Eisenbacteria bacterium]
MDGSSSGARPLRIAFLTSDDARLPIAWSGTPYFMARALSRECGEVVHLGPVFSAIDLVGRVRSRLSARLAGRAIAHDHGLALAREYGWRFASRIPPDADLVVAPAGSTQIAFLKTDVPILYTSDATFALMHGYHPLYSDLPERYVREAHEIERRALARAALVVYPSEWAARSARSDYGVPAEKIRVIPYGANLTRVPPREAALAAEREELRLLFVGGNWERKGGPLAFDVALALREAGWPARLTVCGCVPPSRYRADWVEVIPRLDKRKPEEEERLSRLMLQAAFLILPSLNECFGIVFCEASAHGTPSIATDTGGIAGAVRHGENGFLLPVGAGPGDFARKITEAFQDRDRYRRLVVGSRDAYESRLNWTTWARSACEAARGVVERGGPRGTLKY